MAEPHQQLGPPEGATMKDKITTVHISREFEEVIRIEIDAPKA